MRNLLKAIVLLAITCQFGEISGIASEHPSGSIRLPESDFYWKNTKDFIEGTPIPEYQHASAAAFEAFRDMKYGVRIHWGIYSIYGKPHESWPLLGMSFPEKQVYQELYKTWDPKGFNAEEWMKLFADNGVKMFAITAKHHEGFSMFDTKTRVHERMNWIAPGGPALEKCDIAYSIMDTPFKRDVIRELCNAAHRHGIKIDLYFSNPDWYDTDFRPYGYAPVMFPDVYAHPEKYGNNLAKDWPGAIFAMAPDPTPQEEARMVARHRQQLSELLSNYGKIDMVCLDNWFGRENWPQMRQTILSLRKIQPDVMFRARGIGNYGDYYTPEGFTPGNKENTDMPWFEIFPLGSSFSYEPTASSYKGGEWIIRTLVDVVAKGGNLMVGIGPDANGKFHPRAIENLKEAGSWLRVNAQAIYATRPREGDLWHEGEDIRFTQSKDHQTCYVLSMKWPGETLTLHSVHPKPDSNITLLGYAKPLDWHDDNTSGLVIQIPKELQNASNRPCRFVYCFKMLRS